MSHGTQPEAQKSSLIDTALKFSNDPSAAANFLEGYVEDLNRSGVTRARGVDYAEDVITWGVAYGVSRSVLGPERRQFSEEFGVWPGVIEAMRKRIGETEASGHL